MHETVRDLRRAQIIAAARSLVSDQGLDALTIGALEEQLAFSRGVITYHFKNKDDIVEAVLRSALEEIDAATQQHVKVSASPTEKVRAALHGMVHGFLDHVEAGRVLLSFWSRLSTDKRARKLSAQLYAGYRQDAASIIRAGKRAGVFGDVPVDAVAANMVGAVIGIVTQVYLDPGAIDADVAVDEAANALAARLTGGVTAPARLRKVAR